MGNESAPSLSADVLAHHRETVDLQLQVLRQRMGGAAGWNKRLAAHSERGLRTFRDVLLSVGVTEDELVSCLRLSQSDSRFGFMQSIPHAVTVGSAAADALELAVFGSVSEKTREISSLIQIFCLVLDGLVDEANDEFGEEIDALLRMLDKESWLSEMETPILDEASRRHPVVDLLHKVTVGWVTEITESRTWVEHPSLRHELMLCAETALIAECESGRYRFGPDGPLPDVHACEEYLNDKATKTMMVTALVPICVHGWPSDLDQDAYRHCAELTGTYIGWIDDIHDLVSDLEAGRWTAVLMALFKSLEPAEGPVALKERLAAALVEEEVREDLASTGLRHYNELVRCLELAGFDPDPILCLVQDATLAGMEATEVS